MSIPWEAVADRLAGATADPCTSPWHRADAVRILSRVERLGPLGGAEEEFRRVYRFLHYNEAHRILRVVQSLLNRASGPSPRLTVANNAWKYTVAAYDEWISHARIFYLVAGLLEGTLRSRLNGHMVDHFGELWPEKDEAVPSSVRDGLATFPRASRLKQIQGVLSKLDVGPITLGDAAKLLYQVRDLASDPDVLTDTSDPVTYGARFVEGLTLHQLQQFFTTKRLYGGTVELKRLFVDASTGRPVVMSQLNAAFERYRKVRNDVAHYRPGMDMTFTQALFTAAEIATWLGVDLQHFYGSVDVRESTELSRLVGPQISTLREAAAIEGERCLEPGCATTERLDVILLSPMPADATGLLNASTLRLACPLHRIRTRALMHQHPWP